MGQPIHCLPILIKGCAVIVHNFTTLYYDTLFFLIGLKAFTVKDFDDRMAEIPTGKGLQRIN